MRCYSHLSDDVCQITDNRPTRKSRTSSLPAISRPETAVASRDLPIRKELGKDVQEFGGQKVRPFDIWLSA